jgi:hypothetical protein
MDSQEEELLNTLWQKELSTSSPLPELNLSGAQNLLPSAFRVDLLATAAIGLASAAAADLLRARTGKTRSVGLDRVHAAAAMRSERYVRIGRAPAAPVWDPIAGDYETRDGFIRLHTNYRWHRAAVSSVLGVPEQRELVAEVVRSWSGEQLETAVVEAGGAAAFMRERAAYLAHPQGRAIGAEPLFAWSAQPGTVPVLARAAQAPLEGVRVLDLTRVIAGPVCTRFLSAYGADVLRIDPPNFEEVPALLPESTVGKRRAALDLKLVAERNVLERLVTEAHVLVVGYRSDALARLGLGSARRRELNPALVNVVLDAYGHNGPWVTRRGFDSLVQMSSGIADFGRAFKRCREPFPLPAQALDHATGYFAAAGACEGLVRALERGEGCELRLSLARTAELLWQLGADRHRDARELSKEEVAPFLESGDSAWGALRRLRCPGAIEGCAPRWRLPAGPLGSDAATFARDSA